MNLSESTIVAVSTPAGAGGIAVIRLSGPDSVAILSKCWEGKSLADIKSHTAHLGWIIDVEGRAIDQVVCTVFKGPNSFTGEDVIELSCHGSPWIQKTIVNRLIESGASAATAGEFTRRAFVNGKLDLAQAEGVADLISASSKASARLAVTQLRGEFSEKLKFLRSKLIDIGALLELELDFSEEDVEFAERAQLVKLAQELLEIVSRLASSYKSGNAFKNGVPVVIAGIPNAGKSTLLNAIIGEEKAIVTDIPGTTRDIIEDTIEIGGILFRFYDTAGLRHSDDKVEGIGIERAINRIREARIILHLVDPLESIDAQQKVLPDGLEGDVKICTLFTKIDRPEVIKENLEKWIVEEGAIPISAKTGEGIDKLKEKLVELSTDDFNPDNELIVTNARHYEALIKARTPLQNLIEGLKNRVSADFLAQDLREAEHYLGEITGEVSSEDILHTIFARYCIGK